MNGSFEFHYYNSKFKVADYNCAHNVIMCMYVLGSIWSIEDTSESNNSNTTGMFNSNNNMERGGNYSEWRHNRKPSLPLYLNAPTPYIILKNLSPQVRVCTWSSCGGKGIQSPRRGRDGMQLPSLRSRSSKIKSLPKPSVMLGPLDKVV